MQYLKTYKIVQLIFKGYISLLETNICVTINHFEPIVNFNKLNLIVMTILCVDLNNVHEHLNIHSCHTHILLKPFETF